MRVCVGMIGLRGHELRAEDSLHGKFSLFSYDLGLAMRDCAVEDFFPPPNLLHRDRDAGVAHYNHLDRRGGRALSSF